MTETGRSSYGTLRSGYKANVVTESAFVTRMRSVCRLQDKVTISRGKQAVNGMRRSARRKHERIVGGAMCWPHSEGYLLTTCQDQIHLPCN